MEKIKRKLLCFIGYHSWEWKLNIEGNITEPLTGKIPDRAICEYCKIKNSN